MGPELQLTGAADGPEWARQLPNEILSISLNGPSIVAGRYDRQSSMGPVLFLVRVADLLEWAQNYSWQVLPIVQNGPSNFPRRYCPLV
jgi:hypothetical protein